MRIMGSQRSFLTRRTLAAIPGAMPSRGWPRTVVPSVKRFASAKSSGEAKELPSPTCSRRSLEAVKLLPSYLADARTVEKCSPETPNGALQLGVAESQMLEDWLVPALNLDVTLDASCIYYQPTSGRPGLRSAMAKYIEEIMSLPDGRLDPEGFVVGAGCNAVLENLCLCLAEPGEAVLIPKPYYAAFEFDLVARARLYVQPVSIQDFHPEVSDTVDPSIYYPTTASLEAAYTAAAEAGHAPRILLLSHPHNPLGICYPEKTLKECMDWCQSRQVHLVSDEIYAGSVYRPEKSGFKSILQVASKEGGLGPFVHWVYALSKDFALSGLRVGAVYSENMDIRMPMQKLNDLCQISSQTQVWTETVLSKMQDGKTWTSVFREENHRRLNARCEALATCLEECGIPYLPPTAGLFCWIDLSEYLPSDSGMTDSQRERQLYLRMVQEFGLLLTPGDSMRNERPGFFRIVFTACSDEEFQLSLDRFRTFARTMKAS
jgi:1-aminocyclopropane-1-carboxylate synthase